MVGVFDFMGVLIVFLIVFGGVCCFCKFNLFINCLSLDKFFCSCVCNSGMSVKFASSFFFSVFIVLLFMFVLILFNVVVLLLLFLVIIG